MKLKLFIIMILSTLTAINAQPASLKAYIDYSKGLTDKEWMNSSDAVGGKIKIDIPFNDKISIGILTGYSLYSLDQKNQLFEYGWIFWDERYYDKIVSDLRSDPNLAVSLSSVQKMDVIPIVIDLNYKFDITDQFTVTPSIGGGIYLFSRRMYAIEKWSKYFESENYTFTYSYRNFAPKKSGNPFLYTAAIQADYFLTDSFNLSCGAGFNKFIESDWSFGYEKLPFSDELNINFGITIKY